MSAMVNEGEARGFPAQALRAAMVARRWTISDLAREAGVDRATIRACLAGRMPTLHTEARILAALARKPADEAIKAAQQELSA